MVADDASADDSAIRVRLLERGAHTVATLAGNDVSCDGDVTQRAVSIRSHSGRVRVNAEPTAKLCRTLRVTGKIRISAGRDVRDLRGTLTVTSAGPALRFVAEFNLEDYVTAVLHAEGDALPKAALDAQAIVSRSYAVANRGRHKKSGYDLCDLTHCQLYRGDSRLSQAVVAATVRTAGIILASKANPVSGYFHAACGGATASSMDVFGEPGLRGVSDLRRDGTALCNAAADFEWSATLPAQDLFPGSGETRVLRRGTDGRVQELFIHGRRLRGPQLLAEVNRRYGHSTLRSTRFDVRARNGKLLFKGRGVGHGVGFCQAGAAALAGDGLTVEDILLHYFPDATLTKR